MTKVAIVNDCHLSERAPRARKANYLDLALGKLDYIANNNDVVIILGDLLNSHDNSTVFFNKLYQFFTQHSNKFMTILGNHDILSRNYNALDKTTIGSLNLTGAIKIKTEPFEIDGTTFAVSLVDKDIKKVPIDTNNENILLGHNYFEMETCPEESLTREDLKKLNYKYVLLGHDHSPYEEEFIENSILYRAGALTRTDSQLYNKDRRIYYYQYDTVEKEFIKLEVPSLPSEEVYLEGSFAKKTVKADISFLKIADVLSKFKRSVEGGISLSKVLTELKTPERHVQRIRRYYEQDGLNFY